jgi:hypothetical protein
MDSDGTGVAPPRAVVLDIPPMLAPA